MINEYYELDSMEFDQSIDSIEFDQSIIEERTEPILFFIITRIIVHCLRFSFLFSSVVECTGFHGNEARRRVYRARFSSVTEKDILKAMDNLVEPNEDEARAVDARQEIDLKVGVAFTRFQTSYFQGKYGNLDSRVISLVFFLSLSYCSGGYIYIDSVFNMISFGFGMPIFFNDW